MERLLSIITPVYNGSIDYIQEAYDSIKKQTYKNWEWCICDDGSTDLKIIEFVKELGSKEKIKIKLLDKNRGIACATNEAASLAEGEIISFLDYDDELHENALREIENVFKEYAADVVYTDEALKFTNREGITEHRKPRYSPHYLLSTNYICHFLSVKKELFNKIGGVRSGFEGAQDHDLVLRLTNATRRVFHVPKVLYYWRRHAGSFSDVSNKLNVAATSGIKAVTDELNRRGIVGTVTNPGGQTHYKVKPTIINNPLVSIVIPTHALDRNISLTIDSIISNTQYDRFEIIAVSDNVQQIKKIYQGNANVKIVYDKTAECRLSQKINVGIQYALGSHIVIIHDDIRITSPDWLEWLVGFSQDPTVGVVGCKILNLDRFVQSLGLAIDPNKKVVPMFQGLNATDPGHMGRAILIQNVTAFPSCLMAFKKEVHSLVGGFDESFYGFHFDIDFCLRVRDTGLVNVAIPYCTATHLGTGTRFKSHGKNAPHLQEIDDKTFRTKHVHSLAAGDSYYNVHTNPVSAQEEKTEQEGNPTFIVHTGIGPDNKQEIVHSMKPHTHGLVSYIVPWYSQSPVAVPSLIAQIYDNIEIIVIHDGPVPPSASAYIESMNDKRIQLCGTDIRYDDWGHTPRDFGIDKVSPESEAVVFTGVDNYYLPTFTEEVFEPIATNDGIVAAYCNMVHNNKNWNQVDTRLEYAKIDCGCFIVRSEAAREFRWGNRVSWEDWIFIEKVIKKYGMHRIAKISRMLYIHN